MRRFLSQLSGPNQLVSPGFSLQRTPRIWNYNFFFSNSGKIIADTVGYLRLSDCRLLSAESLLMSD